MLFEMFRTQDDSKMYVCTLSSGEYSSMSYKSVGSSVGARESVMGEGSPLVTRLKTVEPNQN